MSLPKIEKLKNYHARLFLPNTSAGQSQLREYEITLQLCATVKLPLPDGEESPNCCDPDNEMTDREAIESAVAGAISQRCEVFVFGDDRKPAQVFVDLDLSNDLHIEGFEDDLY